MFGAGSFTLLEGSRAAPARPSGSCGIKVKLREEDIRMVTGVA